MSDVLAHHGVKGMKWGVIRDKANSGNKSAQKKLYKADVKWERELTSMTGFININNGIASKMNGPGGRLDKVNNDKRWADKDLGEPANAKVKAEYDKAIDKLFRSTFEETVNELYGESPSGKYTVSIDRDTQELEIVLRDEAAHGFNNGKLSFSFEMNELGHILSFEKNELAHQGVKGMKWGVRKSPESRPAKVPSAGKLRDIQIKEARSRVNEGKNIVQRLLNNDSFGKPLGGRQMLGLMNPGNSKEDLDLAASMTRGQKAALGILAGATAVSYVASKLR